MATNADLLKTIERELHDLCQPLTTLQCRLELAEMCADEVSLMEAVKGSLQETERLFRGIQLMRERLQRELARGVDGDEFAGE
jgi:signal transduction histidine kinase